MERTNGSGWLVLTRKPEDGKDTIRIGDAVVTIHEVRGKFVKVGICAPREIPVRRGEVADVPDR